jgi:NAD(P)-dependent dehydrogenase (short-subunit alcohol dehydrogenase family)
MNDVVLITGASGGMGTATLQLVKLAGGTPIATTRHAAKEEALRRAWADAVFNTGAPDAVRAIRLHPRRRCRWRGRIYRRTDVDAHMHRFDAVWRHVLPGRRRDE